MSNSSEKRILRSRSKCPKALCDNQARALTQKFCLLANPKVPYNWRGILKHYKPTLKRSAIAVDFEVAGSTGNMYNVTLDFVPTCTCPNYAKKQDICKHIFYVLYKVVGVPRSSTVAFQKAYLSSEYKFLLETLESSGFADNVNNGKEAIKKVSYKRKSVSSGRYFCHGCGKQIKTHEGKVRCPNRHSCGAVYHEICLGIMPDLSGLSIKNDMMRKDTHTTNCMCRKCYTCFDHEQGYINVAHVTGQSRVRDTSTYRPCPGYPGYSY